MFTNAYHPSPQNGTTSTPGYDLKESADLLRTLSATIQQHHQHHQQHPPPPPHLAGLGTPGAVQVPVANGGSLVLPPGYVGDQAAAMAAFPYYANGLVFTLVPTRNDNNNNYRNSE